MQKGLQSKESKQATKKFKKLKHSMNGAFAVTATTLWLSERKCSTYAK
jgi:hypothetical protein